MGKQPNKLHDTLKVSREHNNSTKIDVLSRTLEKAINYFNHRIEALESRIQYVDIRVAMKERNEKANLLAPLPPVSSGDEQNEVLKELKELFEKRKRLERI